VLSEGSSKFGIFLERRGPAQQLRPLPPGAPHSSFGASSEMLQQASLCSLLTPGLGGRGGDGGRQHEHGRARNPRVPTPTTTPVVVHTRQQHRRRQRALAASPSRPHPRRRLRLRRIVAAAGHRRHVQRTLLPSPSPACPTQRTQHGAVLGEGSSLSPGKRLHHQRSSRHAMVPLSDTSPHPGG
jgi:hypothetical protein